jgi:tellurite resistance protein TerC
MLASAKNTANSFAEIHVPWWGWGALLVVIAALLVIDLVRHRGHTEPSGKEALRESLAWVTVGLVFGLVMFAVYGRQVGGEYLSGYIIEKSLSVDNVFVWALIFSQFNIPLKYQHRVLFWGIFGALALRAVFIFSGTAILEVFGVWAMVPFGLFLVYTGQKVLRHSDDEADSAMNTKVVALLGKFMPVSNDLDGHRFFTRQNGRRVATSLFACLIVVEVTDVVFAVDSVPAVLAVSHAPFIVFASNAFAILGLRAMYFLLATAKERLHYLSHALGGILIFVGAKMTMAEWVHVPTVLSLGVILVSLTVAIVVSLRRDAKINQA